MTQNHSASGTVTALSPGVRHAREDDLDAVVQTLAVGFHDGDFAAWLIPDTAQRSAAYPRYFRILAEHALAAGSIDIAADGDAVAIWHNYPGHPAEPAPIPDYQRLLADAVGDALPRFLALDQAMEARHPSGPHHYLGHLAVRPHRRRQGLGSALLSHHHRYLDHHQIPAYLEATGIDNERLYQRHGYQKHPSYLIDVGAPAARPMWRNPRTDTPR